MITRAGAVAKLKEELHAASALFAPNELAAQLLEHAHKGDLKHVMQLTEADLQLGCVPAKGWFDGSGMTTQSEALAAVDADQAHLWGSQLLGRWPIVDPGAAQKPSFFGATAEIVIGAVERLESHWCASTETVSSPEMNTSFRAAARRQSLSLRWRVWS